MNRSEALRTLGLSEGATLDEIRAAYRETAQILHPDKFASNKKLQERATEQFKNLQEAYELLTSKNTSTTDTSHSRSASSGGTRASSADTCGATSASASEIKARLAGITAARTQLVAQRDHALDERRNGLVMAGIGVALAVVFGRKLGIFAILSAGGVTLLIWGGVQAFSAHKTVGTLNANLRELAREKKRLMELLEELDELAS